MDKWTLQEEAYKRGLEDGLNARQSKKKGIWLRPWNSTKKSYIWQCSECKKRVYSIGGIDYKFCPYCQAEMEVTSRDSHKEFYEADREHICELENSYPEDGFRVYEGRHGRE